MPPEANPAPSVSRFDDRERDPIFGWPKLTRKEYDEPVTVTLPRGEWRLLLLIAGGEYGSDPVHLGRDAIMAIEREAGFR